MDTTVWYTMQGAHVVHYSTPQQVASKSIWSAHWAWHMPTRSETRVYACDCRSSIASVWHDGQEHKPMSIRTKLSARSCQHGSKMTLLHNCQLQCTGTVPPASTDFHQSRWSTGQAPPITTQHTVADLIIRRHIHHNDRGPIRHFTPFNGSNTIHGTGPMNKSLAGVAMYKISSHCNKLRSGTCTDILWAM